MLRNWAIGLWVTGWIILFCGVAIGLAHLLAGICVMLLAGILIVGGGLLGILAELRRLRLTLTQKD